MGVARLRLGVTDGHAIGCGFATGKNFFGRASLLFGTLATGNEQWLATWQRLEADPQGEEVRRNFPIREPVLWVK